MLAEERRQRIVDLVGQARSLSVTELVERLGVSDMTIRRDLTCLHEAGLLRKVHGGAQSLARPAAAAAPSSSVLEPAFSEKESLHPETKRRLAELAVRSAAGAATVGLAAGSTVTAVATAFAESDARTERSVFITNSLRAEQALSAAATGTVLVTGGERTPSESLIGPIAEQALAGLHVDVLFLGCFAAHPTRGMLTPNLSEASFNRAFIRAADTVCAVFDSSKWDESTVAQFADWDEIDILVTDALSPALHRILSARVPRILTLEPTLTQETTHD